MGTKSEFEAILDKVLGQKSGSESAPFFSSSPNEELFRTIAFSFGPIPQKIFGNIRKIYPRTKPEIKIEVKLEVKSEIEPEIKIAQPPKPREKRKLTFDQSKALSIFVKFGEKVDEFSTDEEIKIAYRRLAKKFHPDLNKTKGDEFKMISKAYKLFV